MVSIGLGARWVEKQRHLLNGTLFCLLRQSVLKVYQGIAHMYLIDIHQSEPT